MRHLDLDNSSGENPLRWCYISTSSQKSEAKPVENPAFPLLASNVHRAQGIADNPFEAYTGQQVAGSNPSLDKSFSMFDDIANNNSGAAPLNFGIDAAKGVASFQPGSLPGIDLSAYMNPFQKQVTDTTMADLMRQRQIAGVADNQSATAARAFGGSRHGVADSLTREAYDRTAASTLANLNFGNFNNAQNMATGDMNRGVQGAGLRLGGATALAGMGDQQLQQDLTRAGAVNQAGQQQRSIEQQQADAAFQEFMRKIMYQTQGQDLINRAMGLLPGGVSNTQSGSGSSFGFTMPMPGK